ncbi:Putative glycosyltransferase EpsE [Luteitalea pratensis]|uniref:Glycosyltransferase EpsE n=2 Tax=Luteitalea pratensis TaxID=1855912 RepID=A0A143PXR2_LUTPR|nr:Putative glycosyltransferase EpsE [Luteitalea pratensis]
MVDVLLAAYNGERHIGQQIESLLSQTYPHWRLRIRVDGGTDNTLQICRNFADRVPDKIQVLEDDLGNVGVLRSFNRLLASREAPYVMFCDQDDLWLPQKIELTVAAMRQLEQEVGASTPILVHTDSVIVDEHLQQIAPSALKFSHRKPYSGLGRACMELSLYGHQVMLNDPLIKLSGSIPEGFVSWDWWFPLVAMTFGRVHRIDKSMTLWRRHREVLSHNKKHAPSTYARMRLSDCRRKVHISLHQCEMFLDRFRDQLPPTRLAFFEGVAKIRGANFLMRRLLIIRYRLFKTGLLKTFGVLLGA